MKLQVNLNRSRTAQLLSEQTILNLGVNIAAMARMIYYASMNILDS